ncbi:peptidase [Novosphingobium profundi]|uniref:M14 family metallopeptidase n=1 Tax=Novosphingobium profundi TaxID=1774954 RepID=UPI001BDA79EE|nr:M14 family metallopeptidase [Novosphingobium profundi]MBT0670955.1 peptidase [Novosphingobium profundi]
MTPTRARYLLCGLCLPLALAPLSVPAAHAAEAAPAAQGAKAVPTPEQVLGHTMGEDRYVPSYDEMLRYWQAVAAASDRVKLIDMGPTTQGRRQVMAVVSSPENLAKLDHYREISRQLGTAEGIDETTARRLSREGKSLVWIDGGLHASEIEAQTALIAQVHDLVASDDPEAKKIRDNVITLFVPDNPDGQQFVADWYMRFKDPMKREKDLTTLPRLYHPYVGHDNNRDFYMASQVETQNMVRVLYRDWRPQIVMNQHQTGPAGTVLFLPPFRNPFNYHYEPLVITSLDEVGAALNSRLLSENKGGATTRSGAHYDTWYNGNLRTSTYFHNAIGILVEIIGGPVPETIPFVPERQVPGNDQPLPVRPQAWPLANSIAYSQSLSRAILTYAADNREKLLYNRWQMGANEIAKGSRDSWTISKDRIDAAHVAAEARGEKPVPVRTRGWAELKPDLYDKVLHDPAERDPRAFIVPVDQHDFPTAANFLTALSRLGVEIERSTAPFDAAGKHFAAGTYIVDAAQAYRAHVLDQFEPQYYPNNFEYPGGPPIPPADSSGYTPAFQMAVEFTRSLEPLTVPTVRVSGDIPPAPEPIADAGAEVAKGGWLISHDQNAAFHLVNRLQKAGVAVRVYTSALPVAGRAAAPGAYYVPYSAKAQALVEAGAKELGTLAQAVPKAPEGKSLALTSPRVGIVDLYGGLHPTGWLRWIFDGEELPYTVLYPQALDKGGLAKKFDIIIIPDAAIPNARSGVNGGMFRGRFDNPQPAARDIPEEYRASLGDITADRTIPALAQFAKDGGTLFAMGSSSSGLAAALGLPVSDPLEVEKDGKTVQMPRTEFYVPGALLTASADTAQPLAWGLNPKVDLFFDQSPVFQTKAPGASVAVSFGEGKLLHSGWAWHPEHLKDTAAVLSIPQGKGQVVLVGPEIALRGQTQGAFKILFNAITLSPAHLQGN